MLPHGSIGAGVLILALSCLVRIIRTLFGVSNPGGPGEAPYFFAYSPPGGAEPYRFRIERAPEGYHAYLLTAPDYRGRMDDFATTHRLQGSQGVYVCWDRPIPSAREAERVAALWSDCTERYILTGSRF